MLRTKLQGLMGADDDITKRKMKRKKFRAFCDSCTKFHVIVDFFMFILSLYTCGALESKGNDIELLQNCPNYRTRMVCVVCFKFRKQH